jgi:hypothetical protein
MSQSRSQAALRCVVADVNLRTGIEKRFWSLVIETDSCWNWSGRMTHDGYGLFFVKNANVLAHRLAWTLATGSVPKNNVCHHCDNPRCVRLDHLFDGTGQENMDDMVRKGRQNKWEKNSHSKLTAEQVKEIRSSYRKGVRGMGTHILSRKYGIAPVNMWKIVTGRYWIGVDAALGVK